MNRCNVILFIVIWEFTCIQKKCLALEDFNLRTKTRPSVHSLIRLYSTSSWKIIRSSSTSPGEEKRLSQEVRNDKDQFSFQRVPLVLSFHLKWTRSSSPISTNTNPFLGSALIFVPFKFSFPALNYKLTIRNIRQEIFQTVKNILIHSHLD